MSDEQVARQPRQDDHQHVFAFLRHERIIGDHGLPSHNDDVYFCSGCLEYKRVEVWRGRPSW